MIYFHGQALESVAPVMVADIRVSAPEKDVLSQPYALKAGARFTRTRDGLRTVTISFSVFEADREARQRHLAAIAAWAATDKPEPMQLPYHGGRLLDVICTALPDPSALQWWESSLRLEFTAFDPYFYDVYEKSAACGTAFFVSGSAPPRMRITRTLTGEASDQAYSDGTDTMTFSAIPAGEMVIDLTEQTVSVGGVSFMNYFTFDSSFIAPKRGTTTITGTGTVKWRERWLE